MPLIKSPEGWSRTNDRAEELLMLHTASMHRLGASAKPIDPKVKTGRALPEVIARRGSKRRRSGHDSRS